MSLPKTLEIADRRLEQAEETLENHSREVIQTLNSERNYRGLYEQQAVRKVVKAGTQAFNAKRQFSRYREDFEASINHDGKVAEEIMNEHDIAANTDQYSKAYNAVEQISLRHERLHRQVKGLSQVMEQNDLGNLWQQIKEDHQWYREPETSRYSKDS